VSRKFGKKLLLNPNAFFDNVIPAKAGIQRTSNWTPAFAGVTLFLNLFTGHDTKSGFKTSSQYTRFKAWAGMTALRTFYGLIGTGKLINRISSTLKT
jgi:hypothetical protein